MTESTVTPAFANIFEELGFSASESEHLIIRADLMLQIRRRIQTQQWSVEQAATQCQTDPDRIEALMQGKIGEFTIEQLITLLSHAGLKIRLEVVADAA
jgi:predicted XRE-type DNA-binding protein